MDGKIYFLVELAHIVCNAFRWEMSAVYIEEREGQEKNTWDGMKLLA